MCTDFGPDRLRFAGLILERVQKSEYKAFSLQILVTDWLTYVQNIMQPSFVGPFNVVGPRHLPTMPIP